MIGVGFFSLFFFAAAGFVILSVVSGFIRHGRLMNQITDQAFRQPRRAAKPGYSETPAADATENLSCQNCGAALDSQTEISPSGDFKCGYCDSWNNVRRS